MGGRLIGAVSFLRRQMVGSLYVRGFSEREIAEAIRTEAAKPGSRLRGAEKTTHVTVHKDIVKCRSDWQTRYGRELEKKREEAIARLDEVQHQAWLDHSKGGSRDKAAALRTVLDAENTKAKIEGTLAPVTLAGDEEHPIAVAVAARHEVIFDTRDLADALRILRDSGAVRLAPPSDVHTN